MPCAVRPSPISAAAVMIAPQSDRMTRPSRLSGPAGRWLDPEETEGTAAHQQDAGQDDQQAAAAAARPRPVRPARPHAAAARPAASEEPAAAEHPPAVSAHR